MIPARMKAVRERMIRMIGPIWIRVDFGGGEGVISMVIIVPFRKKTPLGG